MIGFQRNHVITIRERFQAHLKDHFKIDSIVRHKNIDGKSIQPESIVMKVE